MFIKHIFSGHHLEVQLNQEVSLPSQTDQVALENRQMLPMPLEVNQTLQLHQTVLDQLKVTNRGLQALSLKLLAAQGHPSLDLGLGLVVHLEVVDLGQAVRVHVQVAQNLGLKALNLDLKVQNPDHKAQNLNRKALNPDHNHIPQNLRELKVGLDREVAVLRVENQDQDQGVPLLGPKVQ